MFLSKIIYSTYVQYESRCLYFLFYKIVFIYFLHFASVLKTEKQTSVYLFELRFLICVHCNICRAYSRK